MPGISPTGLPEYLLIVFRKDTSKIIGLLGHMTAATALLILQHEPFVVLSLQK